MIRDLAMCAMSAIAAILLVHWTMKVPPELLDDLRQRFDG